MQKVCGHHTEGAMKWQVGHRAAGWGDTRKALQEPAWASQGCDGGSVGANKSSWTCGFGEALGITAPCSPAGPVGPHHLRFPISWRSSAVLLQINRKLCALMSPLLPWAGKITVLRGEIKAKTSPSLDCYQGFSCLSKP